MVNNRLKMAFRDSIPVMTGYIVLGMGFGVILASAGYGIVWALAMSVFIYAGSMQYVAVGLLTGGVSLLTVALTTLAVNARHLFYGISMIEPYRHAGAKKPYLIFALSDETYSLVSGGDKDVDYCFFVSLFDQIYWLIGTTIGSLCGSFLNFNSAGIDFALTALFITIFTDQWLKSKEHFSAVVGILVTLVSLIFLGSENFLIPAMFGIAVMLLLHGRRGGSHAP